MRLFVFMATVLLGGCATLVNDQMMADGNTWRVKMTSLDKCNGFTSIESCIEGIRPLIMKRGSELCGRRPERVFGCTKSMGGGEPINVSCNVQCNEATTIRVKGQSDAAVANAPPTKADSETFNKAKRCQEKGGVWLNGGCQISVD